MIIPKEADYLYMPITRNIPIDILNAGSWYEKLKLWRTSIPDELLMVDFYQILPKPVNKVFGFSENIRLCCYIPKGFIFNGASIPRLLSPIYLPTGILYLGSFLHDFMYRYAGLIIFTEEMDEMIFVGCNQKGADYVFNEMNERVNDFATGTYPAYVALQTFGFAAWNRCRKKNIFVEHFPQLCNMYFKSSKEAVWEN